MKKKGISYEVTMKGESGSGFLKFLYPEGELMQVASMNAKSKVASVRKIFIESCIRMKQFAKRN